MSGISAFEIREISKPFLEKNNTKAFGIFFIDIFLYTIFLWGVILVDGVLIKLVLSVFLGLLVSLLFVIGHDCCHQSFTSNKRTNKILGVISFLPSFHNFRLWELGHNMTHHAYTNYSVKDYVYSPLSPSEFLQLSFFQKKKYQFYRTMGGHLFYYLIEIWFKKMIFPHKGIPGIKHCKNQSLYSLPLLLYLIFIFSLTAYLSKVIGQNIILCWLFTIVIPFLIFNWLMGFVIYQHHTCKLTRWFRNMEEWCYWEVQVGHSTHIKFPGYINFFLHNIMEHTAHHSNMSIPLYNLSKAQNEIEKRFDDRVKVVFWNWKFYWDSIRCCKLYDYENHRWLKINDQ